MELLKLSEEIVAKLGFPIFMCIGLSWFCYQLVTVSIKDVSDKLTVLTSLTDTLHTKVDLLEDRLERVEGKI